MFKKKAIYIGKKILEPETHFVLVNGSLQTKGYMSRVFNIQKGEQYQLFVPLGYTINKYRTPDARLVCYGKGCYYVDTDTSEGSIFYVNQVPVEVKVYEQDGKQFCPEFGIPVKSKRR